VAETLTLAEIETQFQGEWVLLGDPITDADLTVRGGVLLAHSKDRDEVYRQAVLLRPKRFAVLYNGTVPEGTEIVV
jgi:hypothetical protein